MKSKAVDLPGSRTLLCKIYVTDRGFPQVEMEDPKLGHDALVPVLLMIIDGSLKLAVQRIRKLTEQLDKRMIVPANSIQARKFVGRN